MLIFFVHPRARLGDSRSCPDLISSHRIRCAVSQGMYRRVCIGEAMHLVAGIGYQFKKYVLFIRLLQRHTFEQPKNSQ
jgi:hypothetical protein